MLAKQANNSFTPPGSAGSSPAQGFMNDIKEARKDLIKTGCAKAKGDTLRFMYANLLAFEQRLSSTPNSIKWPIPELYRKLGTVPDNKIYEKVKRMRGL